ncbi:hypothetical protein DSECCO2_120110 [anaerobic digester metagenome]
MECNLAPGSYGVPYNKDGQIVFYCITENQLKQILCHGMSAHGLTPDGGFYGGRNSEVVGSGIAIGKDARVVPSMEGTTLDAIQLGAGTNTAIKTFKIWDWTLLKSDGKIHQDRLDPYRVEFDVENNIFKWRYIGTETWYDLMDVSLLTGDDGKPFTVNEWGNLTEAKITEIQNTVTTGRYLFVVNPYNLAAGTGDNRADNNLPASIAGDMAGHILAYDGDEQAWYDFGPWVGLKGDTGDSIELRNNGSYIQYKATSAVSWINLIAVVDLKGDKGDTGDVPLMQKGATYIQYSRDGGVTWLDLIAIADIQGDPGATGAAGTDGVDGKTPEFRISGTILQWKYTTDSVWINLYDLGAGATITIDDSIVPNSTNPVQSRIIQSTFATKTENDLKLNIGDNVSLAGTGTRVGGLTTGGAVTPMNTVAATPLPTKEYGELLHEIILLVPDIKLNITSDISITYGNNTVTIDGTYTSNEFENMYLFIHCRNIGLKYCNKIISNTTDGIITIDSEFPFNYIGVLENIYIINPYTVDMSKNNKLILSPFTPNAIILPVTTIENVGNIINIYSQPSEFNNDWPYCIYDDSTSNIINNLYSNLSIGIFDYNGLILNVNYDSKNKYREFTNYNKGEYVPISISNTFGTAIDLPLDSLTSKVTNNIFHKIFNNKIFSCIDQNSSGKYCNFTFNMIIKPSAYANGYIRLYSVFDSTYPITTLITEIQFSTQYDFVISKSILIDHSISIYHYFTIETTENIIIDNLDLTFENIYNNV